MPLLEDAEAAYRDRAPMIPAERGAEWAARLFWQTGVAADFSAPTAPASAAVEAVVNHGRWIVSCPDCNGAQLACASDRRFLCNECGNVTVGGKFRPVIWPRNLDAIEARLVRRTVKVARNWSPGETLADLDAENDANGVR